MKLALWNFKHFGRLAKIAEDFTEDSSMITLQCRMEKLIKKLAAKPNLQAKLAAIHLEMLKQSDRPQIESLNTEIQRYLGIERGEWDEIYPELLDACNYGVPTGESIFISMMAIGCSLQLKKPQSRLFRPELRQMCQQHLNSHGSTKRGSNCEMIQKRAYRNWCERGKPMDDDWTDWFFAQKAIQDEHIFLDRCHRLYTSLCTSLNDRISKNLQRMLNEDSNPSRAGRALDKLDVTELKAAHENLFAKAGPVPQANGYPVTERGPEVSASSSLSLTLDHFTCKKMNDRKNDRVVWSGCLIQVKDLESLYNKIDNAVRTRQQDGLNLEPELDACMFTSTVFKDFGLDEPIVLGFSLPNIKIYNGYSPWVLVITCTEIDNEEMAEVLKKINIGVLFTFGFGGACLLGGVVTLNAAAAAFGFVLIVLAAAVAFVANGVHLISSYFNDDDIIGQIEIHSLPDYTGVTSSSSKKITYTAAGNKEGEYRLQIATVYSETTHKYRRNWTIGRTPKLFSEWKEHDPFGFWGGNGEDEIRCPVDGYGDIIRVYSKGTDGYTQSDLRHAEWVGESKLVKDQYVKGTCHWGVRGRHSIRYRAWVIGEYLMEEV